MNKIRKLYDSEKLFITEKGKLYKYDKDDYKGLSIEELKPHSKNEFVEIYRQGGAHYLVAQNDDGSKELLLPRENQIKYLEPQRFKKLGDDFAYSIMHNRFERYGYGDRYEHEEWQIITKDNSGKYKDITKDITLWVLAIDSVKQIENGLEIGLWNDDYDGSRYKTIKKEDGEYRFAKIEEKVEHPKSKEEKDKELKEAKIRAIKEVKERWRKEELDLKIKQKAEEKRQKEIQDRILSADTIKNKLQDMLFIRGK